MQNRFFDEKLRRQKIAEKFRFLKQKTKQRRKIKCHAFQNSHQDRSIVMSSSTRRYDVVIVVVELSASRQPSNQNLTIGFFLGGGEVEMVGGKRNKRKGEGGRVNQKMGF